MTQPGIEPWSPRPLANSLLIKQMAGIVIYVNTVNLYKTRQSEAVEGFMTLILLFWKDWKILISIS